MEKINVVLRLEGKLTDTVNKEGVTPAELAILRSIHGKGSNPPFESVTPLYDGKIQDRTPHDQERHRLEAIYGRKVVERLFPSEVKPTLPVTFKEVGFEVDFTKAEPLTEKAPAKGGKVKDEELQPA